MNRIRWYGPSVVLLVAVAAVLLGGPEVARQLVWAQTDERINQNREALQNNHVLAELSQSFRKVAEVVQPSVVYIRAHGQPSSVNGGFRMPRELEEFLERHGDGRSPNLERFFENQPQQFEGPPMLRGRGSGWVYDSDGHIVTNYHVIAEADEIEVELPDGRRFNAEVIGQDPRTDIAVLKVNASDLHPAQLATEEVQQGEIVFAFGSPFRFEFSMSQGIVSGKSRQLGILGVDGYENFIQTDAAINPGNSGGPLTNIYGEVVGMNTAIASRSRNPMEAGFMGLGFAIPAQMIQDVAGQLIDDGQVSRGYLGTMIEDLNQQMAETFGYDSEHGVLVVEPLEGSPAANAGMEAGDIIVSVDGQRTRTVQQLRQRVAGLRPGTEVEVEIFRNGETMTLTVELGRVPDDGMARRPNRMPQAPNDADAQGMALLRDLGVRSVQTFSQELAEQMDVDPLPGVLVDDVAVNSPAQLAGLMSGMVITHVMSERVESREALVEQLQANADRATVRLRVAMWNAQERRYQSRFVLLSVGQ